MNCLDLFKRVEARARDSVGDVNYPVLCKGIAYFSVRAYCIDGMPLSHQLLHNRKAKKPEIVIEVGEETERLFAISGHFFRYKIILHLNSSIV